MTEDGRRESALAELSLADEELNIADSLLQSGFARVSLSRAYFAHCDDCIRRLERALRRSSNDGRPDEW